MTPRLVAVAVFVCLLAPTTRAQSSPFLPDDLYRKLVNELSGEIAFDHLRTLTQYHAPNGASRDFRAETQWVAAKAREAGLQDVKVHDLPYDGVAWSPISGELWLIETGTDGKTAESKLGSYAETATAIADYSRPTMLEAELVDVGMGTSERDYQGKNVQGKVVLASGPLTKVEEEAVWKRGALGMVSYFSSRVNPADYPGQIAWSRIHSKPDKEGHQPSFAFMISYRTGTRLKQLLAGGLPDPFAPEEEKPAPQTLRVRVNIQSETLPESKQQLVEGWIRGSRHDQQIVLTAHMQEEKTSANDDRSGVANMLEVARALNKLIAGGKLPRPLRDIRFWWVNEIDGEYQYFATHPDERKSIFVNINQDMVGSKAAAGEPYRTQQVTRTPWSRPTFFNDVVESIVTALYQGNNAYLSSRQAGKLEPGSVYTKPIYSRLGGRDRYAVEIVPYFDSSDHLVFCDAMIGAPHGGVTFTNWPDEYIHSSDDDLWQIDRTTLKRNAVAVSALAWFMATLGPSDPVNVVPVFLPNALARIARDARNADTAASASAAAGFDDSENVISHAVQREVAAAESLRSIAGDNPAGVRAIESAVKTIRAFRPLVTTVRAGTVVTEQHAHRDLRVPARIASLSEYLKKRREIKPVKGLHTLMASEALNFADGKRTVWEIFAAVRAESLATGDWYYGTVTPEMIAEYFDRAAAAGVVTYQGVQPD